MSRIFSIFFNIMVMSTCRPSDTELPMLLIIGFDGLKPDHINPELAPNLHKMARSGIWADTGMTPVFPAKTVPNFYAISTGLYCESHGIISNNFFDPVYNDNYTKASTESKWYNGVPIWVANDRRTRHRTGCMKWPGCDANIQRSTPRFTTHFEEGFTGLKNWTEQFDTMLQWYHDPKTPINLGLFFISEPDETEHYYDITGTEVKSKIREIDQFIKYVLDSTNESDKLKGNINIIILSDHGHVNVKNPENAVNLKDYIPQSQMNQFHRNGYTYMPFPQTTTEEVSKFYNDLVNAKKKNKLRYSVYWKRDIPERFHYKNSPRIGPIMVLPDLATNLTYTDVLSSITVGMHGYDNEHPTQRGSFLAIGPAFETGRTVPAFSNVHIYPALNHILGIPNPAPSNGSITVLWPYLSKENSGVISTHAFSPMQWLCFTILLFIFTLG